MVSHEVYSSHASTAGGAVRRVIRALVLTIAGLPIAVVIVSAFVLALALEARYRTKLARVPGSRSNGAASYLRPAARAGQGSTPALAAREPLVDPHTGTLD